MTMEFKNIVFKEENQIGFITLNRPDVYNALNHPLFVELNEVVEKIRTDSAIRVLILTGAGEKSFASGADINPDFKRT
jgi:enoyl-CoA hydratase